MSMWTEPLSELLEIQVGVRAWLTGTCWWYSGGRNPPAGTGDQGLTPGPGRSHIEQGN